MIRVGLLPQYSFIVISPNQIFLYVFGLSMAA